MEDSQSAGWRSGLKQFLKFSIVGSAGVVVNMTVTVVLVLLLGYLAGIDEDDVFLRIFGTAFNVRWYHIVSTLAFLAANLCNYQFNRWWTFKGTRTKWFRGYFAFLMAGLFTLLIQLIVITSLMNPDSPLALPSDIFDDSTVLRTKYYYANVISLIVATPVSFLVNKVWAFGNRSSKVVDQADPQAPDALES